MELIEFRHQINLFADLIGTLEDEGAEEESTQQIMNDFIEYHTQVTAPYSLIETVEIFFVLLVSLNRDLTFEKTLKQVFYQEIPPPIIRVGTSICKHLRAKNEKRDV